MVGNLQLQIFCQVSADTVFTVTVTIGIFILGIVTDRIIKWRIRKKNEKDLQRYFKYLLDKIIDKTCGKLIEIYKDVHSTTDINSGILITPPKILTGDFQRVRNINEHALFITFRSKESFSLIMNHLDFICKIPDEVEKFHSKTRNDSDKMREPFKENIDKYFKLLTQYIENVKNQNLPSADNAFLSLVESSIQLYFKDIARTNQLKRLYDEILRPIQKLAVETNIFRRNSIANQIAELGKEISLDFYYLNMLTEEFRSQYEQFSRYVSDSQKVLIEERAKINWK